MMRIRRLRAAVGMLSWGVTLLMAGCRSAPTAAPADPRPSSQTAEAADEARGVADASLGKQAEVLAHGNLALNGSEQVLVADRFSKSERSAEESAGPRTIFVTRAAILEKDGGKWSEVLLCDEHLKNPRGYLAGAGSGSPRATGWRLEYRRDPKEGLEMKFTPVERFEGAGSNSAPSSGQTAAAFDVRWNKNAKRYQSFDQSHERYLSEVPSLETPQSILK